MQTQTITFSYMPLFGLKNIQLKLFCWSFPEIQREMEQKNVSVGIITSYLRTE